MKKNMRQQLLFMCLSHPEPDSVTVAWALYDGALPKNMPQQGTGSESEPPYRSVLDAMRDGWKVIQVPQLPIFVHGHENETGHLPYEYVLEREVEIDE
jgi:hypothetical protein